MRSHFPFVARLLAAIALVVFGALQAAADPAIQFTTHLDGDTHPAWSPDGLEIAYSHGPTYYWDIWTQPVAGGPPRPIVEDDGSETYPSWSPDGTQIAYKKNLTIWRAPVAGGPPTEMTNPNAGAQPDYEPSWSPLGDFIAFVSKPTFDGADHLYTVALDGSGQRYLSITPGGHREPSWSPDGTRIVYRRKSNGDYLFVIDVQTLEETYVISDAAEPAWSPNGARFACKHQGDIWIFDTDGSGGIQVTDDPAEDRYPCWSPDGSMIAFSSMRSGNEDIWIIDLVNVPVPGSNWGGLKAGFRR